MISIKTLVREIKIEEILTLFHHKVDQCFSFLKIQKKPVFRYNKAFVLTFYSYF